MRRPKGSITDKGIDTLEDLRHKSNHTAAELKKIATLESQYDKIYDLSDTAKRFLIRTYAIEKYNRTSEVTTKQMSKGIICEDDSIDLFSEVENKEYKKNNKRVFNEFLAGTPDLYDGKDLYDADIIIDIKSSWDIITYLKNISQPLNSQYYWQLQGYMALTGAKVGVVAYCLVNTPDSIIEGEKYNLMRKMDVATEDNPRFKNEVAKMIRNMTFNDIPPNERVLRFEVERDDADIEKIYKKVVKCREFLTEFEAEHLYFTKNHRKEKFKEASEQENDV
jgi:hypothetical protein